MSVDFANGSRATLGDPLAGKPLAGSSVLVPTRMSPCRARPDDTTHRSFPGSADLVEINEAAYHPLSASGTTAGRVPPTPGPATQRKTVPAGNSAAYYDV
jgi:hypothetical protein